MKKLELKKSIKNYIYEILSEVEDTPAEKTARDLAIKAEQAKIKAAQERIANLNKGLSEVVQSTDPEIKAIDDKIQNDPDFLKKTKDAMAKAEKGDTSDLAMLMGGFGKMFESDDEDVEPTASDIAANNSFAKLQSKYNEVMKTMKSVVNKYKSAEGNEKQKYVEQLKNLTKLKKELEAMINPSIDDEEEDDDKE